MILKSSSTGMSIPRVYLSVVLIAVVGLVGSMLPVVSDDSAHSSAPSEYDDLTPDHFAHFNEKLQNAVDHPFPLGDPIYVEIRYGKLVVGLTISQLDITKP